jgi:hypothetical protein
MAEEFIKALKEFEPRTGYRFYSTYFKGSGFVTMWESNSNWHFALDSQPYVDYKAQCHPRDLTWSKASIEKWQTGE